MSTIASRDLRNHTASVLKQVAEGTDVTITVHGEPVAVITRPRHVRRNGVPKHELVAMLVEQSPDSSLAEDLAWITGGTTDELDPIR